MSGRENGDQVVVFEFARNHSETVKASLSTFHGRRRADLRVWMLDSEDHEHPTRRGINIAAEDLDKLAEAVAALIETERAA